MHIRESRVSDIDSIHLLHENAFGEPEGKVVAQLAIDLLEDKTALPILSLVAEQDNEIIGNVIFSSVTIEGVEGVSAYILAPLAVARFEQKKGIGKLLINKGLETLKERGAEIVLVYGDPNYYMRTGFKAGQTRRHHHRQGRTQPGADAGDCRRCTAASGLGCGCQQTLRWREAPGGALQTAAVATGHAVAGRTYQPFGR